MKREKILWMAQFALLLALEVLVCFTILGSLPAIGPIVATTMMIPVIITSILLGTGAGTLMGFFSGLFSFIVWTFTPPNPLIAFVFTPLYSLGTVNGNIYSILICFVPRILAGLVAGLSYNLLKKFLKGNRDIITYSISGVIGSLVNTFGVVFGIYFFFGKDYASVLGMQYELLLGAIGSTILLSGIPEAILGGVIALAVCKPLNKYILNKKA
ncbi:MAG: ECF transporter S component [Eubacteriales bacterium]